MGLKIVDLLKWRGQLKLKDSLGRLIGEDGLPVEETGKEPLTLYVRVIGDQDLKDAYAEARIASAEIRAVLRDPKSLEHRQRVLPIKDATREECLEIISSARGQNLQAEAMANVERPDEVKIEEIAADPDAPTLEEQERLDAEIKLQDEEYQKKLDEYVETRKRENEEELKDKSLKELREIAEVDVSNLVAFATFLTEVQAQKVYRGVYMDSTYKKRAFSNVQELKDTEETIKSQIMVKYAQLELGPDEIKN